MTSRVGFRVAPFGGLTGFSLRMDLASQGNAGRSDPQVVIETLVREDTLIIHLSSRTTPGSNAIVDYKVMSAAVLPMSRSCL